METAELIGHLSAAPAKTDHYGVVLRLLGAVVSGGVLSFLVMWLWLGFRPDLAQAVATSGFWMKFAYTFALAVAAFWAVLRLGKPGAPAKLQLALLVIPTAGIAVLAFLQLAEAASRQRMALAMGASSNVCPWRIAVISLPVLAATFIAMRRLAPTRLARTGLAAGLLAGAVGGWVYAFHCEESTAPFVAIWYTLGMAFVGTTGSFLAKRLLRW